MKKRPTFTTLTPTTTPIDTYDSQEFEKVSIKNPKSEPPTNSSKNVEIAVLDFIPKGTKISGRRETKGRAGKPVVVLFQFSTLVSEKAIKELSSLLKEALACGGSFQDKKVVLQCDSHDRISKILEKLGYIYVPSGG